MSTDLQLQITNVTTKDVHVGTPEQAIEVHYDLENHDTRPLAANGAYVSASGFSQDRIAEGSHWLTDTLAPGGTAHLSLRLQVDPGEWKVDLMVFDPNQRWLANSNSVTHVVPGYSGADHRQAEVASDATYWLELAITDIEDIDGGVRVHYSAKNTGTADAPPGTELLLRATNSATFHSSGTQDHVLETGVAVGHTLNGYLTVMLDPGHFTLEISPGATTHAGQAYGEATLKGP